MPGGLAGKMENARPARASGASVCRALSPSSISLKRAFCKHAHMASPGRRTVPGRRGSQQKTPFSGPEMQGPDVAGISGCVCERSTEQGRESNSSLLAWPPPQILTMKKKGAEKAHKTVAHKTFSGRPGHRSSRSGIRTKRFMFLGFRG